MTRQTGVPSHGWQYASANAAARAIRSRQISSLELTKLLLDRIEKLNPKINAIVTVTADEALRRAAQADAALAAGKNWGPLHGVPCTIKDVFETRGVRTTSAAPFLKDYVPKQDATSVARMRDAGMVMLGKTNMPRMAADVQSYSDLFPTANNPWDLSRTPGGSTGGGAAATAAGLGFLALGSDIGGSIRIPASFCGIFGHKPSYGVVPTRGHIPPPPGTTLAPPDLGVVGPLARTASDLAMALRVLGGPEAPDAIAYRWALPPARKKSIREYRMRYALEHPLCAVDADVKQQLQAGVDALRKAGAEIEEGFPDDIDVAGQYKAYLHLLWSAAPPASSSEERDRIVALTPPPDDLVMTGAKRAMQGSYAQWAEANERRYALRAQWRKYFSQYDAFLMPTCFVPAFPHDHSPDWWDRVLRTAGGPRRYMDFLFWSSFATVSGLPATVAPVGFTPNHLPVGMQILGPWLEDATCIFVAESLEPAFGFHVPKGFE
ncbi:MAG: amidase [Bacteroidales bacterium]